MLQRFEHLEVWKKSHGLVLEIYRLTAHFPNEEKFGLTSQMRRAAVSIPANIAEGFKRAGLKDKAHFYNIAQASGRTSLLLHPEPRLKLSHRI